MRPFVIPSLLLVVAGCTDETASTLQIDYTVEVVGRFERVNPANPLSRWIGEETTTIRDAQGEYVCDDTLDAQGPAVPDDGALTLDMFRAELREVGESCDLVFEVEESLTSGARYLSMNGNISQFGLEHGIVKTSVDFETWTPLAPGILWDGVLVYQGTWPVYATPEPPAVGDDWEPKPLDELPIY